MSRHSPTLRPVTAAELASAGEHVPDDIDIHTTAGKLADFERRVAGGHARRLRARAVEKQHAAGKMTARERIEALLDPGSFTEFDEFARHRSTNFGMERQAARSATASSPGTARSTAGRSPIFSQDVTVFGGSLGEVYGEKIVKVLDFAMTNGCPVVGINEGGGARIQEGVVSLGLYGEIFQRNVHASGVIPQISLVMGPAAGGHVYSPALTDFVVMVDKTSQMFITGPDVVKTVTGEDVTLEELGGARTHNTKSGVAHYLAEDEDDALDYVKALLSYLPSNNLDPLPVVEVAPVDIVAARRADRRGPRARHVHPRLGEHALRHAHRHRARPRRRRVPRGAAAVRAEHPGRLRPGRGPAGGRRGQPAHPVRRHARHRRQREGRAVRAHLRRVQHPGAHLRRRPRLPARHLAGVGGHHPPRREADLRLRRGDRPEGHRDHPQGLRRRLRRHGLQAPGRRRQPGLADRADRRRRRAGRGRHPVPQGARRGRGPRRPPRRADRRVRGHPAPTPTSPPTAGTSTR